MAELVMVEVSIQLLNKGCIVVVAVVNMILTTIMVSYSDSCNKLSEIPQVMLFIGGFCQVCLTDLFGL